MYHGNSQVMYSSNRSRSESGSSEGSRGSGSNSTNSRSRRRSHRPRGCRGGINRRKHNQGGIGKNKTHYNKTSQSCDLKSNKVHQRKFSRSSSTDHHHHHHRPVPVENGLLVNNGQQHWDANKTFRRSFHNDINMTKELNYRRHENPYQKTGIMSVSSTYPSSEDIYHHAGQSASTYYKSQYYDERTTGYNNNVEPENDYPLLQSSFSESSSSNETVFEGYDGYDSYSEQNQKQQQFNFGNNRQILPPLPPSEALYHPSKQVPFGPNPYALKISSSAYGNGRTATSTYSNSKFRQVGSSNSVATSSLPLSMLERSMSLATRSRPDPLSDTTTIRHNVPGSILHQKAPNDTNDDDNIKNILSFDYRAHRIEKQRQNVVGGSLFVTSPRSFLMSCKKSRTE